MSIFVGGCPEPLRSLDPVTVADDELLDMAVDAVVLPDRGARERMPEIARPPKRAATPVEVVRKVNDRPQGDPDGKDQAT